MDGENDEYLMSCSLLLDPKSYEIFEIQILSFSPGGKHRQNETDCSILSSIISRWGFDVIIHRE